MAFGVINPVLNFGISDYSMSFSYNIHVYNFSTILYWKIILLWAWVRVILQQQCVQQHVHVFVCLYIRSSVQLNAMYAHESNTWLHCIHCTCSCRALPVQHHSCLWMAKRGQVTRGDRVRKSKGMGNKQFRKELKNASNAVAMNAVNKTEAAWQSAM